jgi:hypothetical protein
MQEQLIDQVISKYKNFNDFKPMTKATHRFTTFDLDYDKTTCGLRSLELFAEGDYSVGPLKVT